MMKISVKTVASQNNLFNLILLQESEFPMRLILKIYHSIDQITYNLIFSSFSELQILFRFGHIAFLTSEKKKMTYSLIIVLKCHTQRLLMGNKNNYNYQRTIQEGLNQDRTQLHLPFREIGPRGCKQLIKNKWQLRILQLRNNSITCSGCSYLIQTRILTLQILDLEENQIGVRGCNYLNKGEWPILQTLILSHNNIENEGFRHIAKGPWPILRILKLDRNNISEQGWKDIGSNQWSVLEELRINSNKIKNMPCALKQSTSSLQSTLNNLRYLNLQHNVIESIEPLSQLDSPFLQYLNLEDNYIATMSSLVKFKSKSLTKMHLIDNRINELYNLHEINVRFEQLRISYTQSHIQGNINMKSLIKCELGLNITIRMSTQLESSAQKIIEQRYSKPVFY